MINNILKKIEKANEVQNVELEKHEVELFKVEDTIKLYNKGLADLKAADVLKQKLAQEYSKALIILEMNVPGQLDDSIKKLIDLGITDKANELKTLKDNSLKKAAEYSKLYNVIK
jgi:hypothetical protein